MAPRFTRYETPRMKITLNSLIGVCLMSLVGLRAAESKPVSPGAHVELFNGHDLTGWVSRLKNNAEASTVWSVKNGVIVCTGRPVGYLRTEQAYENYKVTLEWRFTKAGNTGVLVHINAPDKVWPRSIECQGMHDRQGDFWIWGGATVAEPLEKKNGVLRTVASAEQPLGEWNTYQVVCKGDTATIFVNGLEMNKVTGANLSSGQIGIQSEGAEIEVRRVALDPL